MLLTSKQIIKEELLKLDNSHGNPAQIGYDLSLKSIQKVGGMGITNTSFIGKILKNKTLLSKYTPIESMKIDDYIGYLLHPGVYDIVFHEGCKIPSNRTAFIKQRSSLYRNGAIINSPVFDPGFETENMGTIMFVNEPIFIEENARIAQIYFHENNSVDELYNGQFQNDKQR